MRAIGRGSISSLLKIVVDLAWVGACATLGFIWIVTGVSALALASDGALAGFDRIVIDDPREIAMWTVNGTILCIGAMVVASYLRGVFDTLVEGDPFVAENARRLRLIALVLAVIEGVRMSVGLIVKPLVYVLGNRGGEDVALSLNINLTVWFAVLTLLVLSQVFSEGAAMREEQKMTI